MAGKCVGPPLSFPEFCLFFIAGPLEGDSDGVVAIE